MVTEETKIKDLVSGMKFVSVDGWNNNGDTHSVVLTFEPEQKNFVSYVNEYFTHKEGIPMAMDYVAPEDQKELRGHFISQDYDLVPMDFKLGLLKLICDDLSVGFYNFLHAKHLLHKHDWTLGCDGFENVESVCPEEFLKSIVL